MAHSMAFRFESETPRYQHLVRIWLFFICFMLLAMVMVGGITRLTDSGLSITEWQLVVGFIPPLNEADWQEAFRKYKEIPEFNLVNAWMSLEDFKTIYWWEWSHRFLGRMIGVVFLIPFVIFWLTGQISRALTPKLVMMFVLGGLQGALGWYMVKSGLVDRVDVSQYRLAAHLAMAFFIFAFVLWVALDLRKRPPEGDWVFPVSGGLIAAGAVLVGLIFFQVILGAFVAGLKAGKAYNTWPLMDGDFIPDGLFVMSPWYKNFFENALTVQFDHRMMAYFVLAYVVIHMIIVVRQVLSGIVRYSAIAVTVALFIQAGLGIWALLEAVPLALGVAHQTMALIVFGMAVWHLNLLVAARGQEAF